MIPGLCHQAQLHVFFFFKLRHFLSYPFYLRLSKAHPPSSLNSKSVSGWNKVQWCWRESQIAKNLLSIPLTLLLGLGEARLGSCRWTDSVSSNRLIRLQIDKRLPSHGKEPGQAVFAVTQDKPLYILVGLELVTLDTCLLLTLWLCASASVTLTKSPPKATLSCVDPPYLNLGPGRTLTLWPSARYLYLPHPFC